MNPEDQLAPTEPAPALLDHESAPSRLFPDLTCEICGEELPCGNESCAAWDASPKTAGAT